MTKEELKAEKSRLLDELAALPVAGTSPERTAIQASLSEVNGKLKQLNIEEMRRLKSEADARKSRGVAESVANEMRHADKAPKHFGGVTKKARAQKNPAPWTRGDFILKSAKRILTAIETIPPERRLNFTIEFAAILSKFIPLQEAHVAEYEAERKLKLEQAAKESKKEEPEQWRETWR